MKPYCAECGGDHEPSGARSDCITHWKRRAIEAENLVNVAKCFGVEAMGERAHINPDWISSTENELEQVKDHLEAWIWAYSAAIGIIEGRPGWENCRKEVSSRSSGETLQFPALSQVVGFRQSFEQMERRLHHVESLLEAQIKS